jgi:hypothetical protein
METDPLIAAALDGLRAAGWRVEMEPGPRALPPSIASRYPRLPPLFVEFAGTVRRCTRGDEGAWLLTAGDYAAPPSPDRRDWDDFETMMLEPGPAWGAKEIADTRAFWDRHLVVAQGVAGDLEYLAIEIATGGVVEGMLIDFESPLPAAPDFADFLSQLARVGAAEPTRSLVYAESLALLIHPHIIEDGARPPREKPSLGERLRSWLGG